MMASLTRKFTNVSDDIEKVKKYNMMSEVFPRLQHLADNDFVSKLGKPKIS